MHSYNSIWLNRLLNVMVCFLKAIFYVLLSLLHSLLSDLTEEREAFACQNLKTRQAGLQITPLILMLLKACFDVIQLACWRFNKIDNLFESDFIQNGSSSIIYDKMDASHFS